MIACPLCNAEDSLEVLVDAYVAYKFVSFDETGYPSEETYKVEALRIDEFEDVKVMCNECGEEINWTMFQEVGPKPDSITVEFDSGSGALIQSVAKALYHVTAMITYRDGNPDGLPELVLLLTGTDLGLEVCERTEMGGPDYNSQRTVAYSDIKAITILGMV